MKEKIKQLTNCCLCGSSELELALDLGHTSLANSYIEKNELKTQVPLFPLKYNLCLSCGNFQINDLVNSDLIFKNYLYASSTSGNLKKYFSSYVNYLINTFQLDQTSFVVEAGSNDGVMLESFNRRDIKSLGVDPAKNLTDLANENGFQTINEFFGVSVAEKIKQNYGQCDVFTTNNTYAHLDDINDFTDGVKILLKDDGVFCFENSYLLTMLQKNYVDVLYHEHRQEFSIFSLSNFLEHKELQIFDVKLTNLHGGCIRVFAQHKNGPYRIHDIVQDLIKKEKEHKLFDIQTYKDFYQNLQQIKQKIRSYLIEQKKHGKKIVAYGYPAKATTLCNLFDIGEVFDYIVEDSEFKIGLYSPQFKIPIKSKQFFIDNPPDICVILAWNFENMIRNNNKFFKGEWILPLPEFHIFHG